MSYERPKTKSEWRQYYQDKRLYEFMTSKAGIQMKKDDPHLYNQICREIQHPFSRHYTTGDRL